MAVVGHGVVLVRISAIRQLYLSLEHRFWLSCQFILFRGLPLLKYIKNVKTLCIIKQREIHNPFHKSKTLEGLIHILCLLCSRCDGRTVYWVIINLDSMEKMRSRFGNFFYLLVNGVWTLKLIFQATIKLWYFWQELKIRFLNYRIKMSSFQIISLLCTRWFSVLLRKQPD